MRDKRIYLWQSTLLTVFMGGVVGLILAYLLPDWFFAGYPLISVYFYLLGIVSIAFVEQQYRKMSDKRKILMSYLLVHVVRLLVSIVLMLVVCLALDKDKAVLFLGAFIVNYIIYLIYDSCFFSYKGKNENKPVKGSL